MPLDEVELRMPFEVGDYVDFYASLDHASNVGRIFRPDQEPLLPNWRHLPVGYHGRGGTVVPSGTAGRPPERPAEGADGRRAPSFGPSTRLDIEAELGFVIGAATGLGEPIAATDFADHVFGVVGLNDWSARDIQAWEYVPLGPFLGKSFATSISAWVTPLAALDAAWTDLPGQDPEPLPYLAPGATQGLDIDVEVVLNGEVVSRPPYRTMYWSPAQMLAHLTVNGASTARRRPVRLGHDQRPRRTSAAPSSSSAGAARSRWPADRTLPRGRRRGRAPLLRPGTGGGRIALGDVAGRVEPAR